MQDALRLACAWAAFAASSPAWQPGALLGPVDPQEMRIVTRNSPFAQLVGPPDCLLHQESGGSNPLGLPGPTVGKFFDLHVSM